MNFNLPPSARNPFDALDFTPTDFDEARRALDELPAGVGALEKFNPNYWAQRRRAIRADDRALTGSALEWLMHLPPGVRPQRLCQEFPRVANLLAEAWTDRHSAVAELNDLIIDKRVGRRGFPAPVRDELCSLRNMLGAPRPNL
ncbi:MAG: hypothetical protein OEM00_02310 [Burkholderiaceae bacterium]|nr:hypothetical protein [Burkholderiaceae bacterium]MDH3459808.1 hypothetical protein [Burkholderiaceae bacterium]